MAGIIFSEGSNVNNSVFGKSQEPIKFFLENRVEAFKQTSVIKELFNISPSKHWAEKYASMTAMNGPQPVGENGGYPIDNMQEGYSKVVEHMVWKDKFSISREIIDDGNLMKLTEKPAQFMDAWARNKELFGAAHFGEAIKGNASFAYRGATFSTTTADGVCLFSTSHPSALGGTNQSNCFADAFSADALMAVESAMQDFRGDNSEVLDVAPDTIVIPNLYALKKAVFAAIGADKDPNVSGSNASNVLIFGRWTVIVWQYLNQFITSGTAPWMLAASGYNKSHHGAEWLERVKLEVRSEIADNDANEWRGYERFGVGFNDWRAFAVGGVSGGTQLIQS